MLLGHPAADIACMNGVVPNATASHRVAELKRLINLGEYRVDPHVVADAMLRWAEREFDTVASRGSRSPAQNECSYPKSSRSTSVKVTSGRPAATVPILVREALLVGQAA